MSSFEILITVVIGNKKIEMSKESAHDLFMELKRIFDPTPINHPVFVPIEHNQKPGNVWYGPSCK